MPGDDADFLLAFPQVQEGKEVLDFRLAAVAPDEADGRPIGEDVSARGHVLDRGLHPFLEPAGQKPAVFRAVDAEVLDVDRVHLDGGPIPAEAPRDAAEIPFAPF